MPPQDRPAQPKPQEDAKGILRPPERGGAREQEAEAKRKLAGLLRAIQGRDARALARAARDIDSLGPEAAKAVPPLLEALQAGGADMRAPALAALKRLPPPGKDAAPKLAELFVVPDREVRVFAAGGLGRLGPDAAFAAPALLALLQKSDDPAERLAAAEALTQTGGKAPEAAQALTAALKSPDPKARERAALALRRLGPGAVDTDAILPLALADPSEAVRQAADGALREKLATFGAADLPEARALLRDGRHPRAPLYGLDVVIRLRGEAALPELTALLKHQNAEVRSRALLALRSLGPAARPAVPEMLASLGKATPQEGVQAARARAAIEPQDEKAAAAAVAVLVRRLTSGAGGDAEGEVIDALTAIGLPAANGILRAVEEAQGVGVEKADRRAHLLGALEKLGRKGHSEENVAKLKELASPKNELYQNVRTAAVRARRAMEK